MSGLDPNDIPEPKVPSWWWAVLPSHYELVLLSRDNASAQPQTLNWKNPYARTNQELAIEEAGQTARRDVDEMRIVQIKQVVRLPFFRFQWSRVAWQQPET